MPVAHRIVQYFKVTPGQGLYLSSNPNMHLKALGRVSYSHTRKSLTGYCVSLDESLMSWRSKKKQTVSTSSAKAEYISMAVTICEIIRLLNLPSDLSIIHSQPGIIKTLHVSSCHQVADIFTKKFGMLAFSKLTNKLGLLHIYTVSHQNDLVKSTAVILRGVSKVKLKHERNMPMKIAGCPVRADNDKVVIMEF